MKLVFDTNGNERQKEVARHWLDPNVSEIAYGGSKGSGKSFLGCSLIFGDAFIYPETHYFIARKKLNDLRKFTIPSIYEVFNIWGIKEGYYNFNAQDNFFLLYNGSKVFLLEAAYLPSDPIYERFGSMQMTRGWIEEAGEFEYDAKANLQASIGRWKNDVYNLPAKLLQTCNPSKNYLYTHYYKKFKDKSIEDWKKFVQALPSDNKKLPVGYVESLLRILTKNQKERLLYGNWEYDDDPSALIDYDAITDLYTNEYALKGDGFITADIARFGKDSTCIMVWDGLNVIDIKIIQHSSVSDTAKLLQTIARTRKIPTSHIIVDEDGVGGGVMDIVKCQGFLNGSKALENENYSNLKSQCYFVLSDYVNQRKIAVTCGTEKEREMLNEELEQVKQKEIDSDGKKAVIAKEKVKELIGRSPDLSDCLMMRMYFELNKPSRPRISIIK